MLYRPPARFTGPRPVIINIHGGPGGAARAPAPVPGPQRLLPERARRRHRLPERSRQLGLRKGVREARRRGEARGRGQGHRRAARLDRDAAVARQESRDGHGCQLRRLHDLRGRRVSTDRLRCAIAGNAISNFITYFKDTDPTRPDDRRAEYGDERDPEMREFLTRISPVTQASKLQIPLMIVHGAKDTRVPVDQAEEMARLVRANGVPVWTDGLRGRRPRDVHRQRREQQLLLLHLDPLRPAVPAELTFGARSDSAGSVAVSHAFTSSSTSASSERRRRSRSRVSRFVRRSRNHARMASITADSRSIAKSPATATTEEPGQRSRGPSGSPRTTRRPRRGARATPRRSRTRRRPWRWRPRPVPA